MFQLDRVLLIVVESVGIDDIRIPRWPWDEWALSLSERLMRGKSP